MRNVFDQYEVPENRVTHALACCLGEDPRLMRRFITWAIGQRPPKRAGRLRIVQQQIPGEPTVDEDEAEQRGLPDAWIYGDGPWSLIIESKVAAPMLKAQLDRHLAMADRHGFARAKLLVLSPRHGTVPPGAVLRPWTDVYRWAGREARRSVWASRLVHYLEVAEVKMVAREYLTDGTLTSFNGFCFDQERPYSYREAKRLLNLATEALRTRKDLTRLGMDPGGEGRPAITGSEANAVWDFLPLRAAKRARYFIRHPHLTLAVHRDHLEAFVTIPHRAESQYRRRLVDLGREAFHELAVELCATLGPVVRTAPGASPRLYALQRHYKSQRSIPIDDARLDFDLRTALPGGRKGVKAQPQWVGAVYDALARKRSNLQLGAGVRFAYGSHRLGSPQALDLIARSWIGCRPLLKAVGAL